MTTLFITGPMPPPQRSFCTPCFLDYKSKIMMAHAAMIDALQKDGNDDAEMVFDLRKYEEGVEGLTRPQVAVGIGPVNGVAQLGVTWVCWTHAAIVIFQDPTGLAVSPTSDVDAAAAMAQGAITMPTARRPRPAPRLPGKTS